MFYQSDPGAQRIVEALVVDATEQFEKVGLSSADFSMTLLLHPRMTSRSTSPPTGYSYRGDVSFYPCSVVKMFIVVAAQRAIDQGQLKRHEELTRAMRDMIRWSSNAATNYVIDLLSGTTGDTLLDDESMAEWVEARNRINVFYHALQPVLCGRINLSQKLMDDDRYGREKMFVQWHEQNNHNRLSSDAAAWLLWQIMCGDVLPLESAQAVAAFLQRPLEPDFIAIPTAQVTGYLGAGLPPGARLWSKAGRTLWTGDTLASYRRHDAAYVELPDGTRFTLTVFTQGQAIVQEDTFLPRIGRLASELCAGQ